ncbi:hypothetical protein BCD49_28195 [Pseudofrankia sp. EUN1h]|nr:hypothetical protein BCD49_28195 [Pseudofrankia sp. EUN1h]
MPGLVPPYPDLLLGPDRSDRADDADRAGDGSRARVERIDPDAGEPHRASYSAPQPASGRLGPMFLTLAGRNREQLDFRLSCVARAFLAHTVARPGQPARLDPFGPRADWVMEALIAASRARVEDEEGKGRLAELTDAVRLAEDRWLTVRDELRRGATVRVDLRPSPLVESRLSRRAAHRQARLYHERHPGPSSVVAASASLATRRDVPPARDATARQGGIAPQRGKEQRGEEMSCRQPSHRA